MQSRTGPKQMRNVYNTLKIGGGLSDWGSKPPIPAIAIRLERLPIPDLDLKALVTQYHVPVMLIPLDGYYNGHKGKKHNCYWPRRYGMSSEETNGVCRFEWNAGFEYACEINVSNADSTITAPEYGSSIEGKDSGRRVEFSDYFDHRKQATFDYK